MCKEEVIQLDENIRKHNQNRAAIRLRTKSWHFSKRGTDVNDLPRVTTSKEIYFSYHEIKYRIPKLSILHCNSIQTQLNWCMWSPDELRFRDYFDIPQVMSLFGFL